MVLSTYSDAAAEALQKSSQREFISYLFISSLYCPYRAMDISESFRRVLPSERYYKSLQAVGSPWIFVVAWGIDSGLASIHNFPVRSEHAHYQYNRLRITFKFVLPLQGNGQYGIVTEGVALGYGVTRPFRPLGWPQKSDPVGRHLIHLWRSLLQAGRLHHNCCRTGLWPAHLSNPENCI